MSIESDHEVTNYDYFVLIASMILLFVLYGFSLTRMFQIATQWIFAITAVKISVQKGWLRIVYDKTGKFLNGSRHENKN